MRGSIKKGSIKGSLRVRVKGAAGGLTRGVKSALTLSVPLIAAFTLLLSITLFSPIVFSTEDQIESKETKAPAQLLPWAEWVLEQHPEVNCPLTNHSYAKKEQIPPRVTEERCHWPAQLILRLAKNDSEQRSAHFNYQFALYAQQLVRLPGDARHWPQRVSIISHQLQQPPQKRGDKSASQRALVIERNGYPYLSLEPGYYTVTGRFNWKKVPPRLSIPSRIGQVVVRQGGAVLPAVVDNGRVLFTQKKQAEDDAATKRDGQVRVEVYRKLVDGTPLTLHTEIRLIVSGPVRELVLGKVLTDNGVITHFRSHLPARVEGEGPAKGQLRVQVRPGQHQITLRSRYLERPDQFYFETPASTSTAAETGYWPKEEYWSFQADHNIRTVVLSGVKLVDTSQIDLPAAWKQLPTYRLTEESRMALEVVERGDSSPAENQFNIERQLWLDFDGQGYTASDQISGIMRRDWRLNASEALKIGRAAVEERPVLVTEVDGKQGVEVRNANIALHAVSRIEPEGGTLFSNKILATGWAANASTLSAHLHLPPGWRPLHIGGVDRARSTWISRWSLWDIFLCLVIAVTITKVINRPTGLLAGIYLLLALQERGAPLTPWLLLPLLTALLPLVAHKRLRRTLLIAAVSTALVLITTLVGFSISQFRLAIYPQLERSAVTYVSDKRRSDFNMISSKVPAADQLFEESFERPMAPSVPPSARRAKSQTSGVQLDQAVVQRESVDLYALGEHDLIQTGPGQPTWQWNRLDLQWSGPVNEAQMLKLIYSPPWLTRIWRVVTVVLALLLLAAVLRALVDAYRQSPPSADVARSDSERLPSSGVANLLLPVLMLGVAGAASFVGSADFSTSATASEVPGGFPPDALLKEYEERLTKAPICFPNCSAMNRGRVRIDRQRLQWEIEITAAAHIGVALPTPTGQWSIDHLVVNGNAALIYKRDPQGYLELPLQPGLHRIKLVASIEGDTVKLRFPMTAHNIKTEIEDWEMRGWQKGRVPSGVLEFNALAMQHHIDDSLQPAPIRPFVRIERRLFLGTRWQLQTTVKRLAPQRGAFNLEVPLWPEEKVLTDGLEILEAKAQVQFKQNQSTRRWTSSLEPVEQLRLQATDAPHWVERWQVEPSALWNLTYEGLLPIKSDQKRGAAFAPQWAPWAGEALTLNITRPKGIAGPTQTIEAATLLFEPGKRLNRSTLKLELRSSQGGDFLFNLPEGAEATELTLAGMPLNLPRDRAVTLPLKPGLQSVEVKWEESAPIGLVSKTPSLTMPTPIHNIRVEYQLPRDRWPLHLSGPLIGPSMLYWGVLVVTLLGAFILARLPSMLSLQLPIGLFTWLMLGLGLSTVFSYGVLPVALTFFVLATRRKWADNLRASGRFYYNSVQILLMFLVFATMITFTTAIPQSLLSYPDMKVVGNNSSAYLYRWFQDRAVDGQLPVGQVFSVPLFTYRLVMLLWSLWLATQVVRWAVWGWHSITDGGFWHGKTDKPSKTDDANENDKSDKSEKS